MCLLVTYFPSFPGKRTVVYHKQHTYRRFVYVYEGQRLDAIDRTNRIAYIHIRYAVNGNNIAHTARRAFYAFETFELVKARNFSRIEKRCRGGKS